MHRGGYRKRARGGPRLDRRKGISAVRAVRESKDSPRKEGKLRLISPISISGVRMNIERALEKYTGDNPSGMLSTYRPGLPYISLRAAVGSLIGTNDMRDLDKPRVVGLSARSSIVSGWVGSAPPSPLDAYDPGMGTFVTSYDRLIVSGFGIAPYHGIVDLVPPTTRMYVPAIEKGEMTPYAGVMPDRRRDFTLFDAGIEGDDFSMYHRHKYVVKPFRKNFGRFTLHHCKVHPVMRTLFQRARLSGQVEVDFDMKINPQFIDMVQDMLDPNAYHQNWTVNTSGTVVPVGTGVQALWVSEKEAFETLRDINVISKFKSAASAMKMYIVWQPHNQVGISDADLRTAQWTKTRGIGRKTRLNFNPHRLVLRDRLVATKDRPFTEEPYPAAPAGMQVTPDEPGKDLAEGYAAMDATVGFEVQHSFHHAIPKQVDLTPYEVMAPKAAVQTITELPADVLPEEVLGYELKTQYDEDEVYFLGDLALAIKSSQPTSFASVPDWFWVHWFRKYPYSMVERAPTEDHPKAFKFVFDPATDHNLIMRLFPPSGNVGALTNGDMIRLRRLAREHVLIAGCVVDANVGLTYSGLSLDNRDGGPEVLPGASPEPTSVPPQLSAAYLKRYEDTTVAGDV